PAETMFVGLLPTRSSPLKKIRPAVGFTIPLRLLLKVDFPAPLLPRRATISLFDIRNSMSLRTSSFPYPARRLLTSSMRRLAEERRRTLAQVSLNDLSI